MPSPIPLDNTFGALYVGAILTSIIYGITCLQVYSYFTNHSERDGRFLKAFVALIMALDTVNQVVFATSLYGYLITNFSDFEALTLANPGLIISVASGSLITNCVQLFYAWRLYAFSASIFPKRWIRYTPPLFIATCALTKLGLIGVGVPISMFRQRFLSSLISEKVLAFPALGLDIAVDVCIASGMIFNFSKNRTSIRRTNKAINLLIVYSMSTGIVTTLVAVAEFLAWGILPNTLIMAPFFEALIKLYSCSLMCLLNSRDHVRQELSGNGHAITLTALEIARSPRYSTSAANPASSSITDAGGGEESEIVAYKV